MHTGSFPVHSFFSYNTPLSKILLNPGALELNDQIDDSFGLIVWPIVHLYRAKKYPLITSTVIVPLCGLFKRGHCSVMISHFHEYQGT